MVFVDTADAVPPFCFVPRGEVMDKKTVLNQTHRDMGARMVPFGGWDMPVNYGSQIDEHHAVRRDAGMFDVCHMTVVDLRGAQVRDAVLWSGYLHEAADLIDPETEVLFGGHHWPRWGYADIAETMGLTTGPFPSDPAQVPKVVLCPACDITAEDGHDIFPHYLPDDRIVFSSTRQRQAKAPVKSLSGGNIQKAVVARELSREPRVLIAAQPTRGVDISATEYIHRLLVEQPTEGTATLLISEDLDEIFNLSDRIVVLYEGRIMGDVRCEDAGREQVGLWMSGVQH